MNINDYRQNIRTDASQSQCQTFILENTKNDQRHIPHIQTHHGNKLQHRNNTPKGKLKKLIFATVVVQFSRMMAVGFHLANDNNRFQFRMCPSQHNHTTERSMQRGLNYRMTQSSWRSNSIAFCFKCNIIFVWYPVCIVGCMTTCVSYYKLDMDVEYTVNWCHEWCSFTESIFPLSEKKSKYDCYFMN